MRNCYAATAAAVVLPMLLIACGSSDGDSPAGGTGSPEDAVSSLEGLANVSKVVEITENNDPNDLIGRPNGYEAATVFYDDRVECDDVGSACGATLEVWPDQADAERRAEYIADIQEEAPMIGNEYHYLDGPHLLRVTGDLKPSEAQEYEDAFLD